MPVDLENGVVALFTDDSWLIEPTVCGVDGPSGIENEALSDGPTGGRFQEMIDARGPGFEDHTGTDQDVLASFKVAMRVMLLEVLEEAEAQAAERPGQFDAEYPQILATAEAIDATERELERLENEHRAAKDQQDCNACHEVASIEGQVEELQRQRATLRVKFPLLSRFEPIGPFLELDRGDQQEALQGEVDGMLSSIASTRGHLEAGRLELWTLPPLIDATMRAGGFDDPERRETIIQKASKEQSLEMMTNTALAVLAVGLGFAAAAATGGLSIALTGAAVAMGAADAAWQTAEYFEDVGLANAAEDPDQSFISASDMEGAEFWLVVAWVGAGVDLAAGIKLLKMLGAGAELAEALDVVGHAGKRGKVLAETAAKNLVEELKRLVPDPQALGLQPAGGSSWMDDALDVSGRPPQSPAVEELYPEGWWGERAKGPQVHAMQVEDDWAELGWRAPSEGQEDWRRALGEGPSESAIHPAKSVRAGLARRPRHHVFPKEFREWFEDHGFVDEWDIDNFTVEMDQGAHGAIHGGGDWRTGRRLSGAKASGKGVAPDMRAELDGWAGEWNTTVMDDLRRSEREAGRLLTRDEVTEIVHENMVEFGIEGPFVPYKEP